MIYFQNEKCHIQLDVQTTRIVTLVPSITETLCHFGLESLIVGVTKFCVHPKGLKSKKAIIGGTKNPNIEKILALKPDIVFANREENRHEDIQILAKYAHVYVSDIKNLEDIIVFVSDLKIIFAQIKVKVFCNQIQRIRSVQQEKQLKVCYLIWKRPWMTVGNDTYIHNLLHHFGFSNVFCDQKRYPVTSLDEIAQRCPDVVMLSSEPFPFKDKDMEELSNTLPNTRVILVDGELCSWYGIRTFMSTKYLQKLHQELSKYQTIQR